MIVEIADSNEKQAIARKVLEALIDWFGIDESREEYITGCVDWTFNTYTHLKLDDAKEEMEKLAQKQAEADEEMQKLGVKKEKEHSVIMLRKSS